MAEKLPYVLEILTATEVPCKVDRYMWTLKEEIAPELKQELKPFIFDNVQVLFSP